MILINDEMHAKLLEHLSHLQADHVGDVCESSACEKDAPDCDPCQLAADIAELVNAPRTWKRREAMAEPVPAEPPPMSPAEALGILERVLDYTRVGRAEEWAALEVAVRALRNHLPRPRLALYGWCPSCQLPCFVFSGRCGGCDLPAVANPDERRPYPLRDCPLDPSDGAVFEVVSTSDRQGIGFWQRRGAWVIPVPAPRRGRTI